MVFVLGMSCVCFLLGMIPWQWSEVWSFERLMTMAAIIGLAMAINLMAAALTGTLLPVLLRSLNIDPALAGSVILTTVTDIVGFVSFLGLAAIFLI